MTRMQNAKKQLSEALAALESVISQAINESHQGGASASRSQSGGQTGAGSDLLALVSEVSIIEAKLNEAIAMIATVESRAVPSDTGESRAAADGGT